MPCRKGEDFERLLGAAGCASDSVRSAQKSNREKNLCVGEARVRDARGIGLSICPPGNHQCSPYASGKRPSTGLASLPFYELQMRERSEDAGHEICPLCVFHSPPWSAALSWRRTGCVAIVHCAGAGREGAPPFVAAAWNARRSASPSLVVIGFGIGRRVWRVWRCIFPLSIKTVI